MGLAEETPRYAARLNAFKSAIRPDAKRRNRPIAAELIECAASAGLDAADLNFPDHFEGTEPKTLRGLLDGSEMVLNGLAMRYYTQDAFKLGAFTHPDASIRQAAIDETRQGIDALCEMGGSLMTLWMGQDGFDYSFQMDYSGAWEATIEAYRAVADHNRDIDISIEYKPNEPRAFALMPDLATTLLAIREIDRPNLGVTLDFAHLLYADEMPAYSAMLASRHSRLLGVHLNDGYAKRDDGLAVASVHPHQTLELLVALVRSDYSGAIYFDTFPDHSGVDPVEEARLNIETVERLLETARELAGSSDLDGAISRQDAPRALSLVNGALYGKAHGNG